MARKKKTAEVDLADTASELLEYAQEQEAAPETFNGDVVDTAEEGSRILAENINNGCMLGQIEFLLEHGYAPEAIRRIVDEYDPNR